MHLEDTIAAISTPLGEGGIGVVRLSGPEALRIADRVFASPRGRRPSESPSHRILYGHILDGQEVVDEVLLSVMRAPRTYTREDVVEISCHGGLAPLRRVLQVVLQQGARLAQPGEFTKRAFLNGRIDLAQAEAVLELIKARTEEARKMALGQLQGRLSERIEALRERLLSLCAHLEAHIDFPEEDIQPQSLEDMLAEMARTEEDLRALLQTYEEGRLLKEGVRTAIVGRPNVGKSSLLNALLGQDRAIVTAQPGTTRDVVSEEINLGGLALRVMDTAGIRESHDMVEAEGVRRSLQALREADLVLAVLDASEPLRREDLTVLRSLQGRRHILVLNKADLPRRLRTEELPSSSPQVALSARTGQGLEALRGAILKSLCLRRQAEGSQPLLISSLRHKGLLEATLRGLGAAREALSTQKPLEIVALELREAAEALGQLTGSIGTEEILERVFLSLIHI